MNHLYKFSHRMKPRFRFQNIQNQSKKRLEVGKQFSEVPNECKIKSIQ
jgi:hypothetical protein